MSPRQARSTAGRAVRRDAARRGADGSEAEEAGALPTRSPTRGDAEAEDAPDSEAAKLIPRPTTGAGALLELVVIVALAIGLALVIQAFVVKPYQIPSASMEPTLDVGQRVLVNRVIYHFSDPEIGDIVVFHPPEGARAASAVRECQRRADADGSPTAQAARSRRRGAADTNFIKRIVAAARATA